MSKNYFDMGSPEWAAQVFASPPVRALKGPSKATQYHEFWSSNMSRLIGIQGRNEAAAALVLDYLATVGHIARYKEQPFRTRVDECGVQIVPDFMAIDASGKIFVIEVKSARYITVEIQATLDRNDEMFKKFGITYLYWTDRSTVDGTLKQNLLEMRRYAQQVTSEERARFATHVQQRGVVTVAALYEAGFDRCVIYASAAAGETFFAIKRPLIATTFISSKPNDEIKTIFLGASTGTDLWWESLSRGA